MGGQPGAKVADTSTPSSGKEGARAAKAAVLARGLRAGWLGRLNVSSKDRSKGLTPTPVTWAEERAFSANDLLSVAVKPTEALGSGEGSAVLRVTHGTLSSKSTPQQVTAMVNGLGLQAWRSAATGWQGDCLLFDGGLYVAVTKDRHVFRVLSSSPVRVRGMGSDFPVGWTNVEVTWVPRGVPRTKERTERFDPVIGVAVFEEADHALSLKAACLEDHLSRVVEDLRRNFDSVPKEGHVYCVVERSREWFLQGKTRVVTVRGSSAEMAAAVWTNIPKEEGHIVMGASAEVVVRVNYTLFRNMRAGTQATLNRMDKRESRHWGLRTKLFLESCSQEREQEVRGLLWRNLQQQVGAQMTFFEVIPVRQGEGTLFLMSWETEEVAKRAAVSVVEGLPRQRWETWEEELRGFIARNNRLPVDQEAVRKMTAWADAAGEGGGDIRKAMVALIREECSSPQRMAQRQATSGATPMRTPAWRGNASPGRPWVPGPQDLGAPTRQMEALSELLRKHELELEKKLQREMQAWKSEMEAKHRQEMEAVTASNQAAGARLDALAEAVRKVEQETGENRRLTAEVAERVGTMEDLVAQRMSQLSMAVAEAKAETNQKLDMLLQAMAVHKVGNDVENSDAGQAPSEAPRRP